MVNVLLAIYLVLDFVTYVSFMVTPPPKKKPNNRDFTSFQRLQLVVVTFKEPDSKAHTHTSNIKIIEGLFTLHVM